jgi:copper ion binding protein
MPTTTYTVTGMTCGHCVNAVTAALDTIPGVIDVHVDLETGAVEVEADRPLDREAVGAAVADAGYQLTG